MVMKTPGIIVSFLFAGLLLAVSCSEKDDESKAFAAQKVSFSIGSISSRAPETKGTPAYTENVASLYGSFDARVFGSDRIPAATFSYESSTGKWSHQYDINPWSVSDPIHFWMCMPSGNNLAGVSNLSYDGSSIGFDFKTPATAVQQKDILFATKVISRRDHDSNRNNLFFLHALSGVKFALGEQSSGVRITEIRISGLMGQGVCSITPSGESSSSSCVAWSGKSILRDNNNAEVVFSQTFSSSDVVTYTSGDSNHFAQSFYAAGAANNVNDAAASKTFWFIPQQLSSGVILTVTFTINGVSSTQSVSLGDKAKKNGVFPTWGAGELRTYTLTPHAADIVVTEYVHSAGNVHAYDFESL